MSKIYIIDNKIVKEENLYKIHQASSIKIYELVDEIDDKEFFNKVREQKERDELLKVLLSENDEYKNLLDFKKAFMDNIRSDEELRKANPSWRPSGSKKYVILNAFKEAGYDNKKFARVLKVHKEYLLLRVTNNVEYFESYLRIHNCNLSFKINRKVYEKGGWAWKLIEKHEFDKETVTNFKIAKNNIKNEKGR